MSTYLIVQSPSFRPTLQMPAIDLEALRDASRDVQRKTVTMPAVVAPATVKK